MLISPIRPFKFPSYNPKIYRQTFTGDTFERQARDKEFQKRKSKFMDSLDPHQQSIIDRYALTPENISLAEKFIDKGLFIYAEFSKDIATNILKNTKTLEQAQVKKDVIDKIASYSMLREANVIDNLEEILSDTNTAKDAKLKIDITDKIIPKLKRSKNIKANAGKIIVHVNTLKKFKTAEKILSDSQLYNNEFIMDKVIKIIDYTKSPYTNLINNILSDEKLYNNNYFINNLFHILPNRNLSNALKVTDKILSDETIKKLSEGLINYNIGDLVFDQDVQTVHNGVQLQYKKVLEAPEKYLNGVFDNETQMKSEIDKFFAENPESLMTLSVIFDKETFNTLLRMRFERAQNYIDILKSFCSNGTKNIELLHKLVNCCNTDGKPFMPTQKIRFINLIRAYRLNNMPFDKMEQMADEGRVDIGELNIDLLKKVMQNSGFKEIEIDSVSKEKILGWDINYVHLLAANINNYKYNIFNIFFRAANLEPDFIKYLHNENNQFGRINAKTKAMYNVLGMDYKKWLKPDRELKFLYQDKNVIKLAQIADKITEDMNMLLQTPANEYIKKQFPKFVKNDEFVIPNEYVTSKTKLMKLVKILSDTSEQGQLTQVWKRAKAHNNKNILIILEHLNQWSNNISKVPKVKMTKPLDLTIKMWDRNPQKDIFQGNYSTCCIGMGYQCDSVMPVYLMNTAFNMIELVDNTSGETIGNALCYFVQDSDSKPVFVIDNIEINTAIKRTDKVEIKLRNKISEYAKLVARDVTGKNTKVIMGTNYNDVPYDDLFTGYDRLKIIGKIRCDEGEGVYLDLFGGWLRDPFVGDTCFYNLYS